MDYDDEDDWEEDEDDDYEEDAAELLAAKKQHAKWERAQARFEKRHSIKDGELYWVTSNYPVKRAGPHLGRYYHNDGKFYFIGAEWGISFEHITRVLQHVPQFKLKKAKK